MNILFLEPFFSGSHATFAKELQQFSIHTIDILSLPGRFWKWRMEGASLSLSEKRDKSKAYDLVIASNLLDLALWKSLNSDLKIPHILYVHENQLDYPLSKGETRNYSYGFKDFLNMKVADHVIFNSAYNRDSFLKHLASLFKKLPDEVPPSFDKELIKKSSIIPPGIHLQELNHQKKWNRIPHIIWNHRWEHDKNPEAFFNYLYQLKKEDHPFKLIILGEQYKNSPPCFIKAKDDFFKEIIFWGYAATREDYEKWLLKGDIIISTAIQENFGLSIIEGVRSGLLPLIPHRLAYPEVLGKEFHKQCLYTNDFIKKYQNLIHLNPSQKSHLSQKLICSTQKYQWNQISKQFDSLFKIIKS